MAFRALQVNTSELTAGFLFMLIRFIMALFGVVKMLFGVKQQRKPKHYKLELEDNVKPKESKSI
jgi:hypothetical protein